MVEDLREQLHEETEHPARALLHAAALPSGLFTTPPAMNESMLAHVQCVEMEVRVPQSVQSEPRGQTWSPTVPAPPSSHLPSLANEHASEHAWPETIATCHRRRAETARVAIIDPVR